MLICAALDIVCWTICKWHVASVFFNLHIVSKSPAEIYPPIGAVLELRSRTNLPCLVKLYDIRQELNIFDAKDPLILCEKINMHDIF